MLTTSITERQRQVLILISEGFTTLEISSELGLSEGTVNVHRKTLLHKFKARNVAGLIKKACKEGVFNE